tara:strand:- start:116 stop:532 length:417 start_codon:yes stop_codon:yes gene_type:complete
MKKVNFISNNHDETMKIAYDLSKQINPPYVIGLIGDLAAGKTTFVKGFLKGLGYDYTVSSPTFTLINNYDAKYNVMHVDFYRESNLERWIDLGFKELVVNNPVVIIEWADLLPELLPEDTIFINFEHLEEHKRKIFIK